MFDLKTPIENLYLVGPARAKLLKKLGIQTLQDLFFYFPRTHQDLSRVTPIVEAKPDEFFSIKARVLEIKSFQTKVRKLTLTQALVADETGSMLCVWFNQPFLAKTIKAHETYLFAGRVVQEKSKLMLQNPIYEQEKTEQVHTARLVPIYSLTANLTQKMLRSIIKTYLDKVTIPEYLPSEIIKNEQLYEQNTAVRIFHFPKDYENLKAAQNRLAFDEIFQTQIKVLQLKKQRQLISAYPIKTTAGLPQKIQSLPFTLTTGQQTALQEILRDFQNPYPANRLLEGDVGSGKTIVAALAMWLVAKSGYQCAMLCPTEVLANQHYQNLRNFFEEDGITVALRTSSSKMDVAEVTFGTHALLEKNIKFKNLALVVIDEQHRFGVEQRSTLKQTHAARLPSPSAPARHAFGEAVADGQADGGQAHLLTMSATPIPRSLALTLYGDLDLSILKESPAGRQKIWTKVATEENRDKAYKFIRKQIEAGRQAFVICPLIESDRLGVKSATAEFKRLANEIYPDFEVGLLHGKMKAKEKEQIMSAFKDNQIQILVSTSVVEVGVDVPNATVMMIEGAERFGLAQLHQFRGRVGRSEYKSYCFLFEGAPRLDMTEGHPRLQALVDSDNGFELAEKDLQIRGAGDLYGTEQSGYSFRIANLSNLELVRRSKVLAEKLLDQDLTLARYPLLKQRIEQQPLVHLE